MAGENELIKIAIDESGTIGKGERYFVIAALILPDAKSRKRIRNLVKHTKARLNKSELKGALMDTVEKQDFLNSLISRKDYSIAYLVADKRHINPKLYSQKNLTFNFLFGVLIKEIIKKYKRDMDICVDNRTVKVTSTNSLADYVKIEAYAKWDFKQKLHIHLENSKSDNHLQAVDSIANIIYAKYNYGKKAMYELNEENYIVKAHFPYSKFGN